LSADGGDGVGVRRTQDAIVAVESVGRQFIGLLIPACCSHIERRVDGADKGVRVVGPKHEDEAPQGILAAFQTGLHVTRFGHGRGKVDSAGQGVVVVGAQPGQQALECRFEGAARLTDITELAA
jgi:hypothetical protein